MNKNLKILFCDNTLPPYPLAFYNALAAKHPLLEVMLLAGREKNRKWDVSKDKSQIRFKCHVLPGFQLFFTKKDWPFIINYGLLRQMLKSKADAVVLTGYDCPSYWFALLYAKVFRKKVVFWNGSTLESSQNRSFGVSTMRRLFIKSADAYLAYGSQAKEFLIHYGAKPHKISVGCNTVDIDYFLRESSCLAKRKEDIKEKNGYPAKVILFSGQLIPRKNLDILLEVFAEIAKDDIGLVILGEGPLKNKYTQWCRENKVNNVFFEDFKQIEDLPKYYAAADIFVMPSFKEVWGLVVNEAMACGLPVICSNKAGVAKDLVKDDVNGYTFNPENPCDLKDKLMRLLNDPKKSEQMGKQSLQIIKDRTPEKYTDNLLKAVELTFE